MENKAQRCFEKFIIFVILRSHENSAKEISQRTKAHTMQLIIIKIQTWEYIDEFNLITLIYKT